MLRHASRYAPDIHRKACSDQGPTGASAALQGSTLQLADLDCPARASCLGSRSGRPTCAGNETVRYADLSSRRVVGLAMADLRASLAIEALTMTPTQRRPGPGLILHTDCGCQASTPRVSSASCSAGTASCSRSPDPGNVGTTPPPRASSRRSRRNSSTVASGREGDAPSATAGDDVEPTPAPAKAPLKRKRAGDRRRVFPPSPQEPEEFVRSIENGLPCPG